jgi:hypothetical protein
MPLLHTTTIVYNDLTVSTLYTNIYNYKYCGKVFMPISIAFKNNINSTVCVLM